MNDNKKSNLIINGSGSGPGGDYNSVKISGSGKIDGDFTSADFVINGHGKALGNVTSDLLHVNGNGHILGAVKIGELKVRGSATFDKDVVCDSISVTGTAKILGSLEAETIKVSGTAKIDANCSADTFDSSGQFKIGGLLSADTIDIKLGSAASSAKEIGGEKIIVKVANIGLSAIRAIFSPGIALLKAEAIECNDIDLESTKAKIVRGHNITLGNGCDIDLVEYTGTLKITGDAKVGEEKKV